MNPLRLALLLVCVALSAQAEKSAPPIGKTFFQTNVPFDARIALDVDFVVVHRHGDPTVGEAMRTWTEAGYPTGRMFFIGSDADRLYTTGKFDGREHPDETEVDRDGKVVECAGVRPYMIPTEGWKAFVCEQIRQGIEAGAVTILPEEPLAHVFAGYGEAFKRIWQTRYGTPWEPPHSSPDNYFKSSKLLSDLYFELVRDSIAHTHKLAADKGADVEFLLPIHPLLSHAAGRMTYASGGSVALKSEGLDAFVGQVWTGPIAWGMSSAEGKRMDRSADFFENAYLMYSYFAHLVKDAGIPCYLLADPVEDDPQYTWEEYRLWYNQCLVALLQFPWMKHFEVMPWPDRVFLPGYHMASGTPGPEEYRRALMIAFAALSEVADSPSAEIDVAGNPRVGFLVADTLSWQRGGPEGSRIESVHGFTVPLLRRGIPIQLVPLERHTDRAFLNSFDTLVLTYDPQKPLDPSMNLSLADWVRRGGRLIFLGGGDAYNAVEAWWTQEGYAAPQEHLWEALGVWKRGDPKLEFGVNGSQPIEGFSLEEGTRLTGYAFPGASPFYRALLSGGGSGVEFISRVRAGEGTLLFCGLPSAWFADHSEGADLALRLLGEAAFLGMNKPVTETDFFLARRGQILAARSCARPHRLEGTFVDLLNPDLPVVRDPEIPPKTVGLFREVSEHLTKPDAGRVLFSGPRARDLVEEKGVTRFATRGPEGTPATLRLARRGAKVKDARVLSPSGAPIEGVVRQEDSASDTVLLVVPAGPAGVKVEIDWEE
ncbi:MAG: hypothetical protein GHCLOJNM_01443 [bacterium]|nr:hypothetical protein [bacterium]